MGLKTFDRWARKVVGDEPLCIAAREIEAGMFEADLGHGLCKKRIAIPGHGKSGSVRTLVAKRHSSAVIFLVGREKSQPGQDFPDAVVSAAKTIAGSLQRLTLAQLEALAECGHLKEICCEQKSESRDPYARRTAGDSGKSQHIWRRVKNRLGACTNSLPGTARLHPRSGY